MGRRKNARSGNGGTGSTPATVALDAAGTPFTVHTFTHTPGVTDFGGEAAAALGDVDPARICKTLLVSLDGGPRSGGLAVAVVPVTMTLDLKAVAASFSAKKATMADPSAAERSTGYIVGGISPFGQKRPLATVLDDSTRAHPTIFVSGGRRGLDIEISPDDLVAVLGADVAPVGRS
ncbi:aminoacyl-tRNA deacylase [Corynebacterium sp.]|uniref:aminoacyl-tRNA deacylase n=1 Tax=Corynebacterium sp. TaxID=1720 RepID=UPI003B3B9B84